MVVVSDQDAWGGSPLRPILETIARNRDPEVHGGIREILDRQDIIMSYYARHLAGAALMPQARDRVTRYLNRLWVRNRLPEDLSDKEVIIGSGISAATYAAARVRMGFPKPIVLERYGAEEVGGTFAMSMKPVFYLNSRNRPGPVGLPGEGLALNYIPGAVIQPSDISDAEYQTNADLAWIIRATLAEFAHVVPNVTADYLDLDLKAGRIIDARGLGDEQGSPNGKTTISYRQFMQRMGSMMFPLKGMKRVAVIGGGDGAKCVVESLLGIGPPRPGMASHDTVEKIGWYSASLPNTRQNWIARERPRYGRLGVFLSTKPARLARYGTAAGPIVPCLDGTIVNGLRYDIAVICCGYKGSIVDMGSINPEGTARQSGKTYYIGPCAGIPPTDQERNFRVDQFGNEVGIFRFANRTASLATKLPAVTTER